MIREIDKSSCIGCAKCETACLVGCINEVSNAKREINSSACVDCGACSLACPVNAIRETV
ncbi:MAG: 4Fe-4S binding protein [Treponemataceae bacterium]